MQGVLSSEFYSGGFLKCQGLLPAAQENPLQACTSGAKKKKKIQALTTNGDWPRAAELQNWTL